MHPLATRDGAPNRGRKRCRAGYRSTLNDAASNAPGAPLVAVSAQQFRQFRLGQEVDEVKGGTAATGIEPHVDRTVVLKRESSRRIVELIAGEPKVEEHAIGPVESVGRGDPRQVAEIPLGGRDPRFIGKSSAKPRYGIRISVERQDACRAGRYKGLGVPPGAGRCVHVAPPCDTPVSSMTAATSTGAWTVNAPSAGLVYGGRRGGTASPIEHPKVSLGRLRRLAA